MNTLLPIIGAQYKASLTMLLDTNHRCDDSLWLDAHYKHPFWRVAYHTLFYTDLYLSESLDRFTPWAQHIDELESLGPMEHKDGKLPREGPPYPQQDVEQYGRDVMGHVDERLGDLDLDAASGFFWLPFSKCELQFYNIRHIQHHAGQLAERLRQQHDLGVVWVGSA